ncbi:hypothetical protein NC651_035273 [Populus alba x Populus x berolinensis]|nr:hypothetical protein NC651_035273 [Populus alba x Populus x berolinensis]
MMLWKLSCNPQDTLWSIKFSILKDTPTTQQRISMLLRCRNTCQPETALKEA